MKQRERERGPRKLDVSNPPLSLFLSPRPASLVILCTETDEARARIVTSIIRRGRIEGKSGRRFESYRSSTGGRLPPRIYVVADCSSSSRLLLRRFIRKFPYFFSLFSFFFFPFVRSSSMPSPSPVVEDSNEDELTRFPVFLIFERGNGGKNPRLESAFRFISRHCRAAMNLIVASLSSFSR